MSLHAALALVALTAAAPAVGLAVLRERERRRPGVLLDLLPPEGASADLRLWTLFFQSLFAIAHPWWKRRLLGQPWIALELWSQNGELGARCWVTERLERMVGVLLRGATPGAQVQGAQSTSFRGEPAARARLKLDREPLYSLGPARPEPLRSVTEAVAEAPSAMVQFPLSPDVGWQKRAQRQLDTGAGLRPETNLVTSLVGWLVDSLFNLVLPAKTQPPTPRPRPSRPTPPAEKAWCPGFRTEIRLRVAAATEGEARAHMHGLVATFRGFDGANGFRPLRVWRRRTFDRALEARGAPDGSMVLVADELAALFHLPIDVAGFDSAPARLTPARRPTGEGKVICLLEDGRDTPARLAPADAR